MKTHKNLYASICSFENLWLAVKKAQKGKRFKDAAARFFANLEHELIILRHALLEQSYVPGAYREHLIYEPKKRMISAAPFADRVVHHALCNIIAPLFERTFIYDSYANQVGKGTHKAILRYQHFSRQNTYALKCDIRKYFPSIDHEILKAEIRRVIGCADTLWLIDRIIDGSNQQEEIIAHFPGDDLFTPLERRRGLPIGNLTSQFFANVYLNRFDHYMKENLGCRFYLRFVDDSVVLGNDKAWLWEVKAQIDGYLAGLRLQLHSNKSQIRHTRQGVTFLGFRIFPDFMLLRRQNVVRMRRRLRRLQQAYGTGEISWQQVKQALAGWQGHAALGDTYRLRCTLFAQHTFRRHAQAQTN